jgi:hypothetical protein
MLTVERPATRLWTREEFCRLDGLGLFDAEERLELIQPNPEGEYSQVLVLNDIYTVAPLAGAHVSIAVKDLLPR